MNTDSNANRQVRNAQDVADISSLNPQAEVLQDKVARAICKAAGIAPRDVHPADWHEFIAQADAASAAILQGLIELELPAEVMKAAFDEMVRTTVVLNYEKVAFRAILIALLPLLTKGEKA